jgi:hypothetical protein
MSGLAIGSPGVYDVSVLQPLVDELPPEERRGYLVAVVI